VYFTLIVKKVSTGKYSIAAQVEVNGIPEDISQSGYAEISIRQNGKEISVRDWDSWDEKQSTVPELKKGIYSVHFSDIQLSSNDVVFVSIALASKKGTYWVEFSLEFLKKCPRMLK